MTNHLRACAFAFAFVTVGTNVSLAEPISKEACVEAHSRGQDAREQGKLTLARKLFLFCAQAGCPGAVQTDCARFADDMNSMQPTVNFVARDAHGNDLPNTVVFVDGIVVTNTMDGRPVEIDPGSHTVKFTNNGRDQIVTVVIASGEKGRTVQARFGVSDSTMPAAANDRPEPVKRARAKQSHPKGSFAIAVTGGMVALAGGGLVVYGMTQIPSQCSLATHECSAPPGDPAFEAAANGAKLVNIGLISGGIGVATLAGGLIWYVAGAKRPTEKRQAIAPWVRGDAGGVSVLGRF